MAIEDWMPELASVLGQTTGIEQVHTFADLPAVLQVFPCLVILPVRGTANYSAGGPNISVNQVQVTLYVAAQVLPEAYALAVPFIGRLVRTLAKKMTLNGKVSHALPSAEATFYEGPGAVDYGVDSNGNPRRHLGVIFRIEVKEIETYTVSA